MGRGVQSDLEASGSQDGGEHVGDGALSVGACYMDGAEPAVRVAESGGKAFHTLQARLVGLGEGDLLHGGEP